MTSPSASRADLLRKQSHAFCHALKSPPPPEELLKNFFTPSNPKITEHGPGWCRPELPFLATTFTGTSGKDNCLDYFALLSKTLKMQISEDSFPGPEGFIVDADAIVKGESGRGVVSVVGKGTFESIATGRNWDEKFIYRLSGFDEEGRIGHWEIWADPLSAYDAVVGEGYRK